MNDDEPKIAISDIGRLDVKPGDRVLISLSKRWRSEDVARLGAVWEENFPGIPLLIAEDITSVTVIPAPESP